MQFRAQRLNVGVLPIRAVTAVRARLRRRQRRHGGLDVQLHGQADLIHERLPQRLDVHRWGILAVNAVAP